MVFPSTVFGLLGKIQVHITSLVHTESIVCVCRDRGQGHLKTSVKFQTMILASNPALYLSTVNSFILPNCKLECVSLPDPMPYTATSGNTFSPYDFDLLPLYFVCSLSLCVVYMCGVYTLIRVWHIFMCVDGGQKLNFYLH